MNITDEDVRTVRACLLDADEFNRRVARMEHTHDANGYKAMLAGTIFHLVWQKFGESDNRQRDITQWVARIRARDADQEIENLDELDPMAAERLLAQFLGLPSSYAEYDEETRAVTQYTVMMALYEDLALTEDELDQLLVEAREAVGQAQR